jgi:hypothetical protein
MFQITYFENNNTNDKSKWRIKHSAPEEYGCLIPY